MRKLVMLLLCLAGLTYAGPTDDDILRASDRSRGGDLPGISWTVKIAVFDKPGAAATDERLIRLFAKDGAWSAEFVAPKKIRGQRLLKKGSNMWFMSQGLQKPVPISQRQRLTGGAANGDIASTNYFRDYQAKRAVDEVVDGKLCYVYELTAQDKSVTYDRVRYWVSKQDQLGIKAEFLSKSGKLLKTAWLEYGNWIIVEGEQIPFISSMRIEDALEAGKITRLSYSEITIGRIPDAKFNQ